MAKKKSKIVEGVRIAVVGPGAIGTVFAVYLAKSGYKVVLVDHRADRARRLSKRRLVIQRGRGRLTAKVKVTTRPRGKFDLAILAVKAYSVDKAARKMKSWLGKAPVLAIQNGLGIAEILAKSLPRNPIIIGVTFQAANIVKEGVVAQVANLPTYVGCPGRVPDEHPRRDVPLHNVVAILKTADLPAAEEVDILPLVWGKALVNSAINPICALAGIRNGELLKSKSLRALAEVVCLEGQRVAQGAGIRLPYKSAYEVVQRTCRQTAANRCSMLQDIKAAKPTEIEFLNGALYRIASEHGTGVPVNWALMQIIRSLEKRK